MHCRVLEYIMISFIGLLFLSGCSTTNISPNKQDDFVKYDNTNHVIGDKDSAIKTLFYVEEVNNKVEKKITFYIDKIPYKKEFDLCSDKKDFKVIKSVSVDSNNKLKAVYEDKHIDCISSLQIHRDSNDILEGSYNIKFLDGFDVQDFHGHDLLLPSQEKRSTNLFTTHDSFDQDNHLLKMFKKQYWKIQN